MRLYWWCWRKLARILGPGTAQMVLPGFGHLRSAVEAWAGCDPAMRENLARLLWTDHAFLRTVRCAGGMRPAFALVLPDGLTDEQAELFRTPEMPTPNVRAAASVLLAIGVASTGVLPEGV